MSKKKIIILATVLFLFSAVAFSGCIGGDENNVSENNTTDKTEDPKPTETIEPTDTPTEKSTETSKPSEEPAKKLDKDSVTIASTNSEGITISKFLQLNHLRNFQVAKVDVNKGEGIHIRNVDTRLNSKMLLHSPDGCFNDYQLNPNYSMYIKFNDSGTYTIELYSYDKTKTEGELSPFGSSPSILKIVVT